MSVNKVRAYLKQWGRDQEVVELAESTATVALAAAALGVDPARIATSLPISRKGGPGVLVVAAGDARLDNRKFRDRFGTAPKMMTPDQAQAFTGFSVGGICPFGLPPDVEVFRDDSLRRFEPVFPACGSDNSMIDLRLADLAEYARSRGWVEVCRLPENQP
jgi:prolyl-tRNA editing enzyme YbaK/EbsC (Cys-tRNA(Pro) deacylase)